MASHAYRTEERSEQNIIFARDAINEDRSQRFYCPNRNCEAHLLIRAIHGSDRFCFYAKRGKGHIDGCSFASKGRSYAYDYSERGFDFENSMILLMESGTTKKKKKGSKRRKTGNSRNRNPHTLRQIYEVCKDLYYTETFNGIRVGDMLVDSRSEHMYTGGVIGYRILEAVKHKKRVNGFEKRIFYNSDNMEIYLNIKDGIRENVFVLSFRDKDTFTKIKNEIFNNDSYTIVVAGNWRASDVENEFITNIKSRKQIYIRKS